MHNNSTAHLGPTLTLILVAFSRVCWADVPREVEQLILAQKWEAVRTTLTADNSKARDPVARLLAGHACLATNRNNEAMVLFSTLREPEAAQTCVNWAQQFAKEHPDSAVAHYLMGDALARAGQLKSALVSFDRALTIDSGDVLALSARGVARAISGEQNGALEDLAKATTLRPDFADAHANLGGLWVMRRAVSGAMASFDHALAESPDFILARHGQACVLVAQEEWDKAEALFEQCSAYLPIADIAVRNLSNLKSLRVAAIVRETGAASASGEPPGTTIEVRSLAERMKADLATKTPEQATFYLQDLTRQHGVNLVAQATQIVKNDIVTQMRSLTIQSNQANRACHDALGRWATNKGWGDTLTDWADVARLGAAITSAAGRRDTSLALNIGGILLSRGGRGMNENATRYADQANQAMTSLKSYSQEAVRLGGIVRQFDTHFSAPDKWGPRVLSMDMTNNTGRDLTTASTMAGTVPKNLTGQVYIVSPDSRLAEKMAGTLTKERGIPQQNIHTRPQADLNFAVGFDAKKDYVLYVRTPGPGLKPGGVTSKPAKFVIIKGKWQVTTTFGLLYPMPEPPEGGTQ
jgi:tetratricopeptide (TPR) repeat protein